MNGDTTGGLHKTALASYSAIKPWYKKYAKRLSRLIKDLIEKEDVDIHQIEYRCKTIDSFSEKLARPDKAYKDPLEEITDLIGMRIITYHLPDVERICSLIRKEFQVDELNSADKRASLNPDRFGYLSFHLVVSLPEHRRNLTEWQEFANIKVEIQVRTVLQHAWAAISHKLDYKTAQEMAKEMKRKLFRLSALLELCDEEFQELSEQRELLAKSYSQNIESGQLDIEINFDSLINYVKANFRGQRLLDIAHAEGWLNTNSPNHLLWEVNLRQIFPLFAVVGLSSIKQLEEIMTLVGNEGAEVLRDIAETSKSKGYKPFAIPFDTIAILILYAIRNELNPDILNVISWGHKDYKDSVREIIFPNP
jgi:ppGpp synthetase/RelA/SpoT-type nucleotidyltranferase